MSTQPVPLNASAPGALEAAGLPDAPFVGLRPFMSGESVLFFGRREQTTELLQLLHRERFLAVVGSSGCGKSSLIRAGLIPKLKAGFIVGRSDRWRFLKMRPGDSPLSNLAAELLAAFGQEPAPGRVEEVVNAIRERGARAVTSRLAFFMKEEEANVFLLVDQFEEIFRFGGYDADEAGAEEAPGERDRRRDEAAEFVSVMLALAAQEAVPVYVVLTMRSDFLGDCDAFYGLPQAMNRSQYLVPRLTRQQRQEAIESPARLYGAAIAPRLLDRVLNDMGEEPDQLPVTQHALLRTWEKWAERRAGPLDLEHYEHAEVGGVRNALSLDADSALAGMSEAELLVARRMFQALTKTDARGRRLRRPAHLSEVEAVTGADRKTVLRIVERFSGHNRSFLHVSEDKLRDDPLVDISHESLIRQWATLGEWVKEEVNSREQYLRLASDAVLHFDPNGPRVALWRDPALQLALDWWHERRPNKAWANRYHPDFDRAQQFLDASRDAREREQRDAEAAQRRKLRLLVAATAVLTILLLLAVGGVAFAFRAERKAVQSATEANRARAELEEQKRQLVLSLAREKEATKQLSDEKLKAVAAERAAVEARKVAEAASSEAEQQAERARSEARRANDSLALANRRKEASDLHREAVKAVEAVNVEEARRKFDQVIKDYRKLSDHDAMAYAYNELGNLLINPDAAGGPDVYLVERDQEPDVSKVLGSLGRAEGGEVDSRMLAVLLGYAEPPEDFYDIFPFGGVESDGLRSFGEAIKMQRNREEKLRTSTGGVYRDRNASAAIFYKVGDFLAKREAPGKDVVADALRQAAIDSYCEAYKDYLASRNLEGQVKLLVKIGSFIEKNPSSKDRPAGSPDDRVNPYVSSYKGCAGSGGFATYYEATLPLYRALMERSAGDPEQSEVNRAKLAEALISTGALRLSDGAEEAARKNFDSAAELFRQADDLAGTVDALLDIGQKVKEQSGEHTGTMIEYLGRAADECRSRCSDENLADMLFLIGDILDADINQAPAARLRNEQSLRYNREAKEIYARLGKRSGEAKALKASGFNLYNLNRPGEARDALVPAAKMFDDLGDKFSQGQTLYFLGRAQKKLEQKDEARASFARAKELLAAAHSQRLLKVVTDALNALDKPTPTP